MNSEQLFEKSLSLVPGGVHSPVRSFKGLHTTPRFIKCGSGARITDEENKSYIDFCMSFGPLILGHQNETVKQSVSQALDRGWSYGAAEKYSLELADYIVSRIDHIEQIRFMNSGTEAVMTALRLARGATGRPKIIKFNGCYHGHLDSMLIKAGSGLAGTASASSAGVTEETAQDTLICELGDLSKLEEIFTSHKDEIAGIIIEPLPANNGLMIQPLDFLNKVRELCTKNGALLIFDEVISGFRASFGGMAQDTNITPDIVTYGKVIGGGFPVGAVAGSREIMENLAPVGHVYQAGTLSANPVAMVAGLENVKQLTDDFYLKLNSYSDQIVKVFTEWLAQSEFNDYRITQYKSLFWLHPSHSNITDITQIPKNLTDRFYKLFEVLLNKGIYLSPNAYEIGFVSIAHNEFVIDELRRKLWD